jgi:CzcA family heavy metal efflux pump
LRAIIEWGLKFRLLVVLAAVGTLVVGVAQLRDAPVDLLPEFSPSYVAIQTEALGLSAAEVEQLITVPLEGDLLNGVAGIDTIRSESVDGLSSVLLIFEPGTKLLDARQLVQERLTRAHILPNVSKPPAMLQPLASASRVMLVGLSSKNLSPIEMGLLARWTIRPRLLGIPGVANVAIWGQREHQLQVQVDPGKLHEQGLTLAQIISTTGNSQLVSPLSFLEASTPGSGGFIDTPQQRLQIRHILPIATPEGLSQVPVDGAAGLRLGDVTTIVEDHQPLIGDAIVGDDFGLMLVVEKFPGSNTLEVTRDVEDALEAMAPGLGGVDIDPTIFRPATFIESALDNLALSLLVAGLLLLLAIGAILLDWRSVAVAFVTVPLSLVAAGLVLALRGETMNAMVLGGLALAVVIVVDDAVTAGESVARRLREQRAAGEDAPAADVVREATTELRGPLGYATLIILASALPILVLGGRPGGFFQPLAVSYALAVLASLVVALLVAPALALLLLRQGQVGRDEAPYVQWFRRGYERSLAATIRRPAAVLAAACLVALLAGAAAPRLGTSLLPEFEERQLLVEVDAPTGTSRPEMLRMTTAMSRELRAIPGLEKVGIHVGRAVLADQVVTIDSAALWVTMAGGADYDATVASIEAIADGYPSVKLEVRTYSDQVIATVAALDDRASGAAVRDGGGNALDILTGADEPVVVRIYGKDLEELRGKAEEVRTAIADIPGIVDPRVDSRLRQPTVEVEVDLAAARRYGLKPGDVRRSAATLVQGIEVGSLFEEQKVFEVVVVGVPKLRTGLQSLGDLLLDTPGGGQVRLDDVASVRVVPTPTVIEREAASRRIDVVAGVRGRSVDAVLGDVEEQLALVDFPLEYYADLIGGSGERDTAVTRLLAYGIGAAIAILLLLQAAFGSWRLAAVYFVALPLALSGGVLLLFALGHELTVGSVAGLVAVYGLAARQLLVLVDRCRRLEQEGEPVSLALVARGVEERLPALLATTVGLAVFLLPFAVLPRVDGFEIVGPLAIAVLGGLVTSTLLTLFVVPALYLRFSPSVVRERFEAPVTAPLGP